jgi:hypothetical protein
MSEPKPPGYRKADPYPGQSVEYRVMDDGKSTLMLPHQDGDEYIVRQYPHPYAGTTRRFGSGWEAADHLRTLPAGSSGEVLHVRDDGATEVARYWPMTVIDCAG